ncbi:MAG: hypothetical protein QOC83_4214, partial [Pseudonocardiales bacterium]|nr:hypothetical protein [Pseudonocardiales bacterium]
ELRDRASRVGERFHLDAPGWFRDAEDTPFLSELATALWRDQRIAVRHRRWGHDEVDRLLDPLGLVLKAGVWYLVAGGPTGAPRTYRVSRVLSLRTSPGRTHRPPDFSLAEFWRTRSAELRAALWRAEATVRLSPRGLELVPVLLGQLEARAVAESAGEPAGDGWVTATLPIESTRHAESVLLRLGADVEVLAPPELRERLAAVARALVARYDNQ